MCERAMWLADSHVRADGPARRRGVAVPAVGGGAGRAHRGQRHGRAHLKIEITGPDGGQILSGEEVNLRIVAESEKEAMFGAFHIGISQGTAMPVFVLRYASSFPEGQFELRCKMQTLPLPKGRYSVWGAMRAPCGSGPKASTRGQPLVRSRPSAPTPSGPPMA